MDYLRSFLSGSAIEQPLPSAPVYSPPPPQNPQQIRSFQQFPQLPQQPQIYSHPIPNHPYGGIPQSVPPPQLLNPVQTVHNTPSQSSKRKRMMASPNFHGPGCKNLVELMESLKSMPSQYKSLLETSSKKIIETMSDPEALHVWESGSDLDELLQLTQVILKLKLQSVLDAQALDDTRKKRKGTATVIIALEEEGVNHYKRITALVAHLTNSKGRKHCGELVCAFENVVIVRGVRLEDTTTSSAAVMRINMALERMLKKFPSSKHKIIWHQGPTVQPLLTWINTTTKDLRSALAGITVTAALNLANGVQPTVLGHNTPEDLLKLESYAKRLGICVVFLDAGSQLIIYEHVATYLYWCAYYIHTFLPEVITRQHFHKAFNDIVGFCFRIYGASRSCYGADVVASVKKHLQAKTAGLWAESCINPTTYTKEKCRGAGAESAICSALQLADAPVASLRPSSQGLALPFFARLPLCPSASGTPTLTSESYRALPVTFNYKKNSLRVSSTSAVNIFLPKEGQTVEHVTARIQGTMTAVLQCLLKDKGQPTIGDSETSIWKDIVTACVWALDNSEGKMPKSVAEKVIYVKQSLDAGSWTTIVGAATKKFGNK